MARSISNIRNAIVYMALLGFSIALIASLLYFSSQYVASEGSAENPGPPGSVQGKLLIEYFYMPSCYQCESSADEIMLRIATEYADEVTVEWIDVSKAEGLRRWEAYGFTTVPAVVINHEYKITRDEISYEKLKEVIEWYLRGGKPAGQATTQYEPHRIAIAFLLGLLTGFSPCSMGVLAFVLAYTLAHGHQATVRENVARTMAFSLGLVDAYLLVGGLVMLLAIPIHEMPLVHDIARWCVIALSFAVGLNALGVLKLPRRFRQAKQDYTIQDRFFRSPLGLFALGMIIAILPDAPCEAPFLMLILLEILTHAARGVLSLLLFGLGVSAPIIAVSLMGTYSFRIARDIRLKYGNYIKLIGGLVLMAYGAWLLLTMLGESLLGFPLF